MLRLACGYKCVKNDVTTFENMVRRTAPNTSNDALPEHTMTGKMGWNHKFWVLFNMNAPGHTGKD